MNDEQERAKAVEITIQQIERVCETIRKTLVERLRMGAYKPIFSRGTPGVQYLACLIDADLNKLAQGRIPIGAMSEAAFDLACKFILYSMHLASHVSALTLEEIEQARKTLLKVIEARAMQDITNQQDKDCCKDFDAVRFTKKARKPIPKKEKRPVSRRKTRVRTPKKQ